MKILYGIQGTGNGHITRARAMAKSFAKSSIKVDYFFSGRPANKYFDMSDFNDYHTREGFTFAIENGCVNKLKTLKNIRVGQFIHDVKKFDLSGYDLVINDFEPISAWAAKLAKVPCIGISHQASFLSNKVPSQGATLLTRLGLKLFAPADCYLGVHWFPYHQNIIPPFIEPVKSWQKDNFIENKILVYLPFEDPKKIIALLQHFPEYEFYCYHPQLSNKSINHHIHLRSPCRVGFLNDLVSASGTIGNAGFELSSEALRYGKKLLLKPLDGQFEQASNAFTLVNAGLATSMSCLNADVVDDWLSVNNKQAINFPSDPSPLTDWIAAGASDVKALSDNLWQNIQLPMFAS